MKQLTAKLLIALAIIGGTISFGMANTNTTANLFTDTNITDFYKFYTVPANSTHTHRVFFTRGRAIVGISGDGDTDLDLYVVDSFGNSVRSESHGDKEVLKFPIRRSGYFKVKVVNRGGVYNSYEFGYRQ